MYRVKIIYLIIRLSLYNVLYRGIFDFKILERKLSLKIDLVKKYLFKFIGKVFKIKFFSFYIMSFRGMVLMDINDILIE